jgi:hypothetical protein
VAEEHETSGAYSGVTGEPLLEAGVIDRLELRDVGDRILLEARGLVRQEDVARHGGELRVGREDHDDGGGDRRTIEIITLDDDDGAIEAWLRAPGLGKVVPKTSPGAILATTGFASWFDAHRTE